MGILDRLERRSSTSLHPSNPSLMSLFGGGSRAVSGVSVTADSAMTVMAIYRAVRLLANTMASLPLAVYERMPDGSRRLATKHPLTDLLTRRPNRWQTAFGFKQMLSGHFDLRGNAYAEIFADGRGRVSELIPLHPDRVIARSGDLQSAFGSAIPQLGEAIWYEYHPLHGPPRVILWDEMLHLRGFTQDGLVGLSPLTVARETIGLALTNREFAARYLANNATPGGALVHPKALSTTAKAQLRASWNEQHGSVANVGRVAILEEDLKWVSIGFNPKDSQFLEQRQFDIEEIARMFDLPPHKLMDLSSSTNNNIEHQGIEYVMDAILPRAVNLEETLERDLLLPSDLGRYYIECNLEGLQRGDSAARGEFYSKMFSIGAFTPNDIRSKENLDNVEGGDDSFIPLNMVPLRQAAQLLQDQTKLDGTPAGKPALTDGTDPAAEPAARASLLRRRIARAHERLFIDAFGRVLKKEAQAGRRALQAAQAATDIAPVTQWLEQFYPDHEAFVCRALEPVVQTAGGAIGAAVAGEVRLAIAEDGAVPGLEEMLRNAAHVAARTHIATSRAELRRVIKDTPADQRAAALDAVFTAWEGERSTRTGATESESVAKVVTEFIYRAAGLTAAA